MDIGNILLELNGQMKGFIDIIKSIEHINKLRFDYLLNKINNLNERLKDLESERIVNKISNKQVCKCTGDNGRHDEDCIDWFDCKISTMYRCGGCDACLKIQDDYYKKTGMD